MTERQFLRKVPRPASPPGLAEALRPWIDDPNGGPPAVQIVTLARLRRGAGDTAIDLWAYFGALGYPMETLDDLSVLAGDEGEDSVSFEWVAEGALLKEPDTAEWMLVVEEQ